MGCGREIQEGLAFCPYCGRQAPLADAPPATPTNQLGTRRQQDQVYGMWPGVPWNLNFCPYCGRVNLAASSASNSISNSPPHQGGLPPPSPMLARHEILHRMWKADARGIEVLPVLRQPADPKGRGDGRRVCAAGHKDLPWMRLRSLHSHKFCPECGRPRDPR